MIECVVESLAKKTGVKIWPVYFDLVDAEDLIDRLRGKKIGDRAELLVKRGLKEMTVEIEFLETKK